MEMLRARKGDSSIEEVEPPDRPRNGVSMKTGVSVAALRLAFRALGPVAPTMMGGLAFRLWLRTSPRRIHPMERPVLARARSDVLSCGGHPLAVYSWGEGPSVLLMHGWNGRAAQMTPLVDPLIAAGYGVVALDAPAHGRSPGRNTNVFEILRALEVVGRRYGPFRGLIAHSLGALAGAIAITEGRLEAERAVLLAPVVTRGPAIDVYSGVLGLPAAVHADFSARVDAFAGADFWDRPQPRVPILVVHDRNDADVPLSESTRLPDRWSDVRVLSTSGLGHRGVLRDPSAILPAVAFMKATKWDAPMVNRSARTAQGRQNTRAVRRKAVGDT